MGRETTADEQVVHRWLRILADGTLSAWDEVVSPDLSFETVFMPGNSGAVVGRDANRAIVGEFWKSWDNFAFHDIEVLPAVQNGVFFATARSEANTVWGAAYANRYVFKFVIGEGRITTHTEYFNPLPVLEVFKDHLG